MSMKDKFRDWWRGLGSLPVNSKEDAAWVCWGAGYVEAIRDAQRDAEDNLAKAIIDAERKGLHASMNLGTMAQVAAHEYEQHMRQAFALVTGTAVGGMHFEARLADAKARVGK